MSYFSLTDFSRISSVVGLEQVSRGGDVSDCWVSQKRELRVSRSNGMRYAAPHEVRTSHKRGAADTRRRAGSNFAPRLTLLCSVLRGSEEACYASKLAVGDLSNNVGLNAIAPG